MRYQPGSLARMTLVTPTCTSDLLIPTSRPLPSEVLFGLSPLGRYKFVTECGRYIILTRALSLAAWHG